MAFILHTTRSISQSGVRILSLRKVLLTVGSGALLLVVGAFCAGIFVGQNTKPVSVVSVPQSQRDPIRERFTFDRLGDMTGRLVKLETDARSLVTKISALEILQSRLATLDGHSKIAALPNTKGGAAGGRVMAPQGCSSDILNNASAGKNIEGAEKTLACLQTVLDKVEAAAAKQSVAYMSMPVRQPVNTTRIGSGFGDRIDPINGRLAFHSGIDFDAPIGTPIRSAGGGRVKSASLVSDLGNMIEIDHGNGLVTRYAHTSKMYVKVGDLVTPGQVIGEVGNTGRSTGPHLHFEIIHNGRYVDPAPYLSVGAQISNV
jgi:murein DD-endopeptidase MepM/ murein hydrolase activator NlpD